MRERGGARQTDRQNTKLFIRPRAHNNRSEHSTSSNSRGSSDGLKLRFLMFKALKTNVDTFSMMGTFARGGGGDVTNFLLDSDLDGGYTTIYSTVYKRNCKTTLRV